MRILLIFAVIYHSLGYANMSLGKKNVLATELKQCCTKPMTGFYRNGYCHTGPTDHGTHIVCATVTKEFLEFTKSKGNDLMTPRPEYQFPGLVPGNQWCLCALRWMEAFRAGVAPKLDLEATESHMLEYINLETLKKHSL